MVSAKVMERIIATATICLDIYFPFFINSARSKHSVHSDARKKDRRKVRASSLESSAESESSALETGDGNSGQVAAVSSTASFKSPAVGIGEEETNGEKQVKHKYIYIRITFITPSNSLQIEKRSFFHVHFWFVKWMTVQLKKNCTIQRTNERKNQQ